MTNSNNKDEIKKAMFKPKKARGGFGQQGGGFSRGKGGGFAPRNIAKASGRKR